MHRFYLPPQRFRGDYAVSDDPDLVNQLAKVLRAKHGDKFGLFDGGGSEFTGQLVELGKIEAKFLIIDQRPGDREPLRQVTLFQSLLKSDKFDWLLQKAVELGAVRIVPVVSERCIIRNLTAGKRQRLEAIIKEATEQCGGSRLTELAPVMSFSDAIASAGKQSGAKLIAWEQATEYDLADASADNILLFIGPEGGYSAAEIAAAESQQIVPVTLGRRILRAETAAIAGLAKLL